MGGPDREGLEGVARPPDDENWHIIFKPVDCPVSCSEKGLEATKTVLPRHLSEVPMLAALVGECTRGMLNALDLVRQPALALDWIGYVVDTNAAADTLFGDDIRVNDGRLALRDRWAAGMVAGLLDRVRASSETADPGATPIVVRRSGSPQLLIRVLPIRVAASGAFLGAFVLLVLTDLRTKSGPDPIIIGRAFGLTRAEARLASLVASGMAPDGAARNLGISCGTARAQLKAVLAKTETHRQSELVALLSRLDSL
jgi:DNA-binding CsgD family transcriptional regulator